MLKLRHIRPLHINQRLIALDNPLLDQRLHPQMIVPDAEVLEIPPRKHQRAEIRIDRLQQLPRRRKVAHASRIGALDTPVAVDAQRGIVADAGAPADAAEGFDGEDVAFFHSLVRGVGFGGDEWDLFGAVDSVGEDVVAR